MVKFRLQPKPCTGSTVGSSGMCLAQFECKQTGGRADGTCASGFGVCCIQEAKCGSVVQHNDTYLVNDGYPMKTSSIMNCVYNIHKINDNICQLRLDFETLVLAGPNDQSICREDKLSVLSPAEGPSVIICGTNSGKHTPENCLQYYTDYTATIESFNFKNIDGVHQIGGLQYTICIRAKEGVCGIRYTSNTFSVSGNGAPGAGPSALSGDTSCIKDFLMIPSLSQPPSTATSPDRYCGTSFAERSTYSKPFQIRLVTDENETGDTANRGFSLTYTQIPC
ncbi:uncharacterized protein [Palaemon carinicauda]|uniref:uncharacterized protein isoform X2 n=1 Tax=Palaemon carinicauda TaxID=392227 RepID=UPI0035B64628